MKRSPIQRSRIRQLRSDEADPVAEPKRYTKGDHVVLRWKVAPREYVERYERDEHGVIVRTTPRRDKRIDVERAVELYDSGLATTEVAQRIECDPSSVSRALRRQGTSMRGKADYYAAVDVAELTKLYESGIGVAAAAAQFGVGEVRARKMLREAGVIMRKPGGNRRGTTSFESEFRRQRPLVFARSGDRCEADVADVCVRRAHHVHHRLTRARGGSNELSNLLACCWPCHTYIHAHPTEAYERGWMLRSVT